MRYLSFLLAIFIFLSPCCVCAWGAEDGFGESNKVEGDHFAVYYKPDVDLVGLVSQLDISKTDQLLANQPIDSSSLHGELASRIDVLFSRASDVLDMHIYSLKADIKVFATQQQLTDFYNKLFNTRLPCTGFAFYVHDFKSIYISAENFRREVLGHEMGHAVMSHYFVVQPSIKIQEVLAGYVEYQLRKSK